MRKLQTLSRVRQSSPATALRWFLPWGLSFRIFRLSLVNGKIRLNITEKNCANADFVLAATISLYVFNNQQLTRGEIGSS
jgi:hypothetical protein